MGIGIASAIVLYVLAFGFFTYLCVVADPDTSSIAKLCTVTLPKFILSRLRILIGEKAVKNITDMYDYALVITYLVIVLGSWSIMFAYGYPFITKSKHVSSLHKVSPRFSAVKMKIKYFIQVICKIRYLMPSILP